MLTCIPANGGFTLLVCTCSSVIREPIIAWQEDNGRFMPLTPMRISSRLIDPEWGPQVRWSWEGVIDQSGLVYPLWPTTAHEPAVFSSATKFIAWVRNEEKRLAQEEIRADEWTEPRRKKTSGNKNALKRSSRTFD
jgi:hypothetical protein